jgi:hypothetical protein
MAKKKELWTDKDRQGLAEKKGLNLGTIITEKDKREGMLFTKKDKAEGLL